MPGLIDTPFLGFYFGRAFVPLLNFSKVARHRSSADKTRHMQGYTQMSARRVAIKPGTIARAGLWSALAFALNLVWEIAHARLYTLWATADRMTIAWSLLHCSLGDVAIALAAFALAGIALRQADWPVCKPWAGGAIVIIGTMAYTAWSEWYNVYQSGSWSYTAGMPMIFGIGLSPLLQWLILPPLLTIAYRALWLRLLAAHNASNPIPAHGDMETLK